MHLNIIKAVYDNPIANKPRMPSLTTPVQFSTGSPGQSNLQAKEIQAIRIGKEEVKLSLISDDKIIH